MYCYGKVSVGWLFFAISSEALQAMCAYLSIKLEAKRLLEEELRRRRQRVKGWVHMSGDDDGGGGVLGSLARKTGERLSRWKEVAEEYYWWVARLLRRGVWWSRGEQIRKIEGLYGTGVGTYFVFLRFLVVLNLCIAFIRFQSSFPSLAPPLYSNLLLLQLHLPFRSANLGPGVR